MIEWRTAVAQRGCFGKSSFSVAANARSLSGHAGAIFGDTFRVNLILFGYWVSIRLPFPPRPGSATVGRCLFESAILHPLQRDQLRDAGFITESCCLAQPKGGRSTSVTIRSAAQLHLEKHEARTTQLSNVQPRQSSLAATRAFVAVSPSLSMAAAACHSEPGTDTRAPHHCSAISRKRKSNPY